MMEPRPQDYWTATSALLCAKLDPKHVRPAKDFGPKGDYIEGWHVIAEANRIFGFGAWSYDIAHVACVSSEPRKIGRAQKDGWAVSYIARVVVRVAEANREDVGAGHGYDADLGLAHESAIKEAVTDALKRALRTFGSPFGLALYDKARAEVGSTPTPPAAPEPAVPPPAKPKPAVPRSQSHQTAIDVINSTETTAGLVAYWDALKQNNYAVAAHPAVIAAKDARKTALGKITPPTN